MMRADRRHLLAKVAYNYFIEGKTQAEIAAALNVYRTTVSRMINEAKEEGIIRFTIEDVDERALALEQAFQIYFGLAYLEIVPDGTLEEAHDNDLQLATVASDLVRRLADDDQVIGVSWGSTLSKVSEHVSQKALHNSIIVPLVGGPSYINTKYHVNTIVYELAQKLQSPSLYVNAEAVQESKNVADAILRAEYFSRLQDYWDRLDFAILGIGGNLSAESSWRSILTKDDLRVLEEQDAVGDILCRFVDGKGNILSGDLYDRTVGMTFEQLLRVRLRLGIARGEEKVRSILALLRNHGINALVTDEGTARQILEMAMEEDQSKE